MSNIFVPRNSKLGEGFTVQEISRSAEHPGRQTNSRKGYQSAATFIDHLIQLRKPVILCGFCRNKFDPKHTKYRRFFCLNSLGGDGYIVNGRCDDCKADTRLTPGQGTMFVSEESYNQICLEPQVARRRARERWKLAASTVWNAIRRS